MRFEDYKFYPTIIKSLSVVPWDLTYLVPWEAPF